MQQPFWKQGEVAEPQQRPVGVSLIAVGYWLAAALLVVYGINEIAPALSTPAPTLERIQRVLDRLSPVVFGVMAVSIGWGLWRLRQEHYIVAVALHCFGIFGSLLAWGRSARTRWR